MKKFPESILAQRFWQELRLSDCPVYDMHGHMGAHNAITFPSPEAPEMVKALRRINGKLVFSHHWALFGAAFSNQQVADIVRRHPDFLRFYVALNPHYPEHITRDLALYDSWKPWTVGFKLLADYHRVRVSDAAYAPALERADAEKALVLFHTWCNSAFDGPAEMRKVIARYPNIRFLIGHSFNSQWEEAIALVRDYPENVYLELTSIPGNAGVIELLVNKAGSHRILFGTDLPWFDEYQALGGILGSRISDEAMHDILHRNAQQLLPGF